MNENELLENMKKVKENLKIVKNRLKNVKETLEETITFNGEFFCEDEFLNIDSKINKQIKNLNDKIITELDTE